MYPSKKKSTRPTPHTRVVRRRGLGKHKTKSKNIVSVPRVSLARTPPDALTHSFILSPLPLSLQPDGSMRFKILTPTPGRTLMRFTPPRACVAVRTPRRGRGARAVDREQAGHAAPAACRGCGKWWSWTPSGRRRSWRACSRSSAASSTRSSTLSSGAHGDRRIPVEQSAAKGRTLPAMAAAIAPTAAVTRQVRV